MTVNRNGGTNKEEHLHCKGSSTSLELETDLGRLGLEDGSPGIDSRKLELYV